MYNDPDPNKKNDGSRESLIEQLRRPGCNVWGIVAWMVILGLVFAFLYFRSDGQQAQVEINYSTFRQELQGHNVAKITVRGEEITGELKNTRIKTENGQEIEYMNFITYLPSFGDDSLLNILEEQNVEIQTELAQTSSWLSILINFLPFIFLIGVGYYLFRRMQSQGSEILSVGKSKARLYDRRDEHTTFDDVAGLEGTKVELKEIIDFLKQPERFEQLGGEIPKGVLLVGPPGTGKTLLARAVAGEAGVPFFNITGSDFMEMFVGVGASRVRTMFNEAKRASPSMIFIDELDSIGRTRGAGLGGGHDEREQTLNQLLSEMDGFEPNTEVILMAATNRPDILDPALLRPGRFDRQITVNLPTLKDRIEILKIHARNKPLAADVVMEKIARGTPGFSGADLENLLNEAALLAARRGKKQIETEDIESARDKLILGLERKSLVLTDKECEMVAYHEAGHAIVAAILPNSDPIHKVTIVPRGRAMGVTQQLPERDKYIYPREYILDRLAVMMGGRAAEELVYQTMTSGAENDLKQATQLARKMVLDWGMSEQFNRIALGGRREQVFLGEEIASRRDYSEMTAHEVDQEIMKILNQSYQRAFDILKSNHEKLEELAGVLVEKEELTGEEVLVLLGIEAELEK